MAPSPSAPALALALSPGSSARVNLAAVRAHDSSAPYLALVRQLVRKGERTVYIASLPPAPAMGVPAMAYVRAWSGDFLGDVRVPVSALSPA